MAKGVFLTNPELNKDDVGLTASSELGRRAGAPVPFASNSNLLNVTTIGDAGDDLTHDFEIFGTQDLPKYAPFDGAGARLYAAPTGFTAVANVACGATAKAALTVVEDRLYLVVSDAGALRVYVWDGSGWVLKASTTGIANDGGGIACAAIGQNAYIVIANNTDSVVEMFRFNGPTNTIGQISDVLITTDGTVAGIALATNGATFAMLVTRTEGGGKDVDSYFGSIGDMALNDQTINEIFATAWTTEGDVRCCALTFGKGYGFVAAFRCGTTTPGKLRLAISPDGDNWTTFKNYKGAETQPAITQPWGDGLTCALTLEYRRVFVWRLTAAALNGASTAVQMKYFDGKDTWSGGYVADGSAGIDAATQIAAVNWRGEMFYAWRNTAATITARRTNSLTTSTVGTFNRELSLGEQMFIAGIDDDSQTALFFVATGSITSGDKFRIEQAEYDYRVAHLLDDFMSKVWRGNDDAEQVIQFDAGSGRAFVVDTVAIYGTNLPSLTFEMSDDVAFGSLTTTAEILSTVQTAAVVSVDRNQVKFAAGTFEDQKFTTGLAAWWVRFSAGITTVFRILNCSRDTLADTLIVDGSAAGASGTATIFRNSMGCLFAHSQTPARYARLVTPTVALPADFYQISRVIFGLRFVPPVDYRIEWARRYGQQQGRVELKSGARFNTLLNFSQRPAWTLSFRHYLENIRPVANFFGRTGGGVRLFGFWPDPTALVGNQPETFPVYFTADPPEIRDLGAGAAELSCVIEGQI